MKVKLADVAENIFAGGDVPKDKFSAIQTETYNVPVYANAEKDDGLYGYTDVARVTEPCVTVAARGTIGFVAKRTTPFFPVIRLITVIPQKEKITLDYLYYALRYCKPNSSGTSIPQLTVPDIKEYSFELINVEKQHKITEILDKVDRLMKMQQRQLDQLDLLVKCRFVEIFGDPVSDSKHWGQKPLKEMLESIRYGASTPPEFSDVGYAFIRATNIKSGHIVKNGMKYIPQSQADKLEKCKLSGGEVLIVRSGVNAGDTCVVTDEYIGQYAGYDMILVLKSDLHPVFFNTLVNTTYMEKVIKPLTRRVAQPHLNSEQIRRFPIIQVPCDLQKQFATFVEQVDKSKVAIQKSLDEMQLLFDSLMQKYFG